MIFIVSNKPVQSVDLELKKHEFRLFYFILQMHIMHIYVQKYDSKFDVRIQNLQNYEHI